MKDRNDWFDGITELVHAATCIASNNMDGGRMIYNINEFFSGWRKKYVKDRMIALYGEKANLTDKPQQP